MSRFLAWLCESPLRLAGGVLFVAVRALEGLPSCRAARPSLAAIARAKDLLRRNDPRRLTPNATREVRIAGPDLETLLNFARRGIRGSAALQLREGGADVHTPPRPPALPGIASLGRYLNVSAQLGVSGRQLAIEQAPRRPRAARRRRCSAAADQYVRHTDLAPGVACCARASRRSR